MVFDVRMGRMNKIGLVIIGDDQLSQHLDAITAVQGIEVRGHPSTRLDGENLQPSGHHTYITALQDPNADAAVINTGAAERGYWIRQALENGKHVIASPPIARNYKETGELLSLCKEKKRSLFLIYPAGWRKLKRLIRSFTSNKALGVVLAIDIKLDLPQRIVRDDNIGIVEGYFFECLNLIIEEGNPLDVVFSRTRTLALNRPYEDWAWSQLRFKNGLEATIHLNGLAERGNWVVDVYGLMGRVSYRHKWCGFDQAMLKCQYEEWIDAIKGGRSCGEEDYMSSRLAVEWIQQSARMDRPIIRKEVKLD